MVRWELWPNLKSLNSRVVCRCLVRKIHYYDTGYPPLGEDYKPRMAVVVVQKRISTRMFAQGSQGYENPSPGTIMDHTITRKGW